MFSFKPTLLQGFFFVIFLPFKCWFHYFYTLILYELFWKHKVQSSTISQIGKTTFTTEFLTAANTLSFFLNWFKIIVNKMAFNFFFLNVFETILGLDSGNRSSKTNSKRYLKVGVLKIKEICKLEIFRQSLNLF